ncbi:MAG TPA: ABC transporter permease [Cyanobacteria bacterium UBA11149]|nr:ABC transporter permease [Cyanobacteria bacterium UBA11367]HBE57924.1 ABC transporter permease [Cyanobacteria bacterium UBA11366]HBK66470.1 ABC transporter permease [Cyanobacteria bacterium UBA11166]HBR76599.1 ABC transporter permease [Cyanobacteria bacterium UBA11159]HBS70632.1 ABC transporter permease [Cyanobacteria bacterium UBA11153]HBW92395.1 ABC transporter permease [Cyanobacteria bacterium UBA11149]HCA95076.1 ABC transporter permease [Cyanobacteria bacterium UBA9226]
MKRILSQCIKELSQFKRDRLTLALAFLLPFITLLIFGFAIRLETKNIPLTVRDFDVSPLSRAYTERLFATNQFQPINHFSLPFLDASQDSQSQFSHPEEAIDRGIAKAAVIIPPDFSRQIKSNSISTVQVLVDGTDVNNARIIKNSIQATTRSFLRNSGLQPVADKITAYVRIWFNPGRKESLSIVPGLYAVILWVYPSLLISIAMVREKEKGTILQVYASSLSAVELLLGKGLAYLLIGISEALFVMGFGSLIWGLNFAGDPTLLLIGTLIFLADSVSFGLLIGVRSKNQNSTIQAVALIGFLTALLLSGFIYPLSNIPFPLSLVSNIVPARYYIEITRDAYVRGTGWPGIWFPMLMLIILGLLLFNAARMGLKRMQLSD